MIVNNYNITFSDGKAPALNCKYSEVNREYILKPDVELNSDTYSAELVIVKPDMTFTINSATINNDGNIIITIPSQATIVKGVAQYLVRIYNNNTDVYSAYGEMWVDDNLLTDDVIESVAEVNGYKFPDDFALKDETATINDNVTAENSTWSSSKISGEINNALPNIIDDDDVLENKTWSSDKISYELGNIQPYHVYTTTEQPVGRWIDGRTVYEKTVIISNPVSTGARTTINDPAFTNCEIISFNGYFTRSVTSLGGAKIKYPIGETESADYYTKLYFDEYLGTLAYSVKFDVQPCTEICIIVRYVKTLI